MRFVDLYEKAKVAIRAEFARCPDRAERYWFHTLLFTIHSEQLLDHHPELNREVVLLTAVMHDIAKPMQDLRLITDGGKVQPHHSEGAEIARRFLRDNGYELADRVAEAILSHGGKAPRQSPEAHAAYDAQRLSDSSPALLAWLIAKGAGAESVRAFFKKEFQDGLRVPPHFPYSQILFNAHRQVVEAALGGL